jgi:hypothetical protein
MTQNQKIQGFYYQPRSYPCQAQTFYSLNIINGSFHTHLTVHVVHVIPPHLEDVFEVGLPNEIINIM